jgi:hypothetical protein
MSRPECPNCGACVLSFGQFIDVLKPKFKDNIDTFEPKVLRTCDSCGITLLLVRRSLLIRFLVDLLSIWIISSLFFGIMIFILDMDRFDTGLLIIVISSVVVIATLATFYRNYKSSVWRILCR